MSESKIRTIVDSGIDAKLMERLLKHGSKQLKEELLQSMIGEMRTHERHQRIKYSPKEVRAAFKLAKKMANTRVRSLEEDPKIETFSQDLYTAIRDEVLASKTGQRLTKDLVKEFKDWFMNKHSFPAEMRYRK